MVVCVGEQIFAKTTCAVERNTADNSKLSELHDTVTEPTVTNPATSTKQLVDETGLVVVVSVVLIVVCGRIVMDSGF